MSLDTQVALARPLRGESTHLSRAARQIVAPFLQKLYEIVNDPANEELIKWSENGDSFFVLDHERFAREVLGRWFKHQKFASFVRQLNMYGFHKVPHLQQGVLKSDTDTEPWHFEHPNFHRGQPDLLCLIQRKKQLAHGQPDDATVELHDPIQTTNPLANVTQGHLMDINSIVNGVAAIKHHQQAISSDLSSLKQSNDALWKEAVAARQRHAKHQDTINRILKFLAGVFGHTDEGAHSPDGSHTPPQVTPRIRQRLMIANGRASSPKGRQADPMEVNDGAVDLLMKNLTNFAPERFASIDTPNTSIDTPISSISSPSIASIAPTEVMTPMTEDGADASTTSAIRPSQVLSRSSSAASTPRLTSGSESTAPTTPTSPNDAVWQAAIQHMMSSPNNFQRILQAIAIQQQIPNLSPSDTISPSATNSTVATYDPAHDFSRWISQASPSPTSGAVSQPLFPPLSVEHADDSPPLHLLLDESNRLQKYYRDASEIDADMDMLQTSINSLIQNLGIDPTSLSPQPEDPAPPPPHNSALLSTSTPPSLNGFTTPLPPEPFSHNSLDSPADSSHPDYLLDSLLSQIGEGSGSSGSASASGSGIGGLSYMDITDHYDPNTRIDGTSIEDASTEQLTAFLDEASAAATGAADSPAAKVSPQIRPNTLGTPASLQKRKSDAVDMSLAVPSSEEGTGKKVKRKR